MPTYLNLWTARNSAVLLYEQRFKVLCLVITCASQLIMTMLQWYSAKKREQTEEEDYWTATRIFDVSMLLVCLIAISMCTIQFLEVCDIMHRCVFLMATHASNFRKTAPTTARARFV